MQHIGHRAGCELVIEGFRVERIVVLSKFSETPTGVP